MDRFCLILMVNFRSLLLQHHILVLDLSSRSSPSPRQQHLYLRRQILCLQSMVVFASAQSKSKSPNSNLPLPGKQAADSLVNWFWRGNWKRAHWFWFYSLFAILVSESNQNPHYPWIPEGRGSIFSFVSFTESAMFVPAKKKALFGFSGAATDIRFSAAYVTIETTHLLLRGSPKIFVLPKHTGLGSLFVRDSGVRIDAESFTPFIPLREGNIGNFGGAAEAVGANPPDDFTLFTFTGQVDTPLLTF